MDSGSLKGDRIPVIYPGDRYMQVDLTVRTVNKRDDFWEVVQ